MTCIAGLVSDGKVFIGGDSAGVAGWDLTVRADSKVFRNSDFIFGFTTSFRMGQLLRYSFTPPACPDASELDRYMATSFIDGVRNCLKAGGFSKKENEVESGGTFLVGHRGRLFLIGDNFQVGESVDGMLAVGCGDSYALGSLFSTKGQAPELRITTALQAAERFSAGVRGPFQIEKI
jgi:hypothetical protein